MRFSAHSARSASFLLVGGFIAWSLAFTLHYVVLSFGCAYGWDARPIGPTDLNRVALTGTWILSLLALGAMTLAARRLFVAETRTGVFMRSAGVALNALALATTVGNFFMVTALSTCL